MKLNKCLLACILAIFWVQQLVFCEGELGDFIEQADSEPDEVQGDDVVEAAVTSDDSTNPQASEVDPSPATVPDEWSAENTYQTHRANKIIDGLYWNRKYQEINDVLVDNVDTNDTRLNMDFALEWLEKETKVVSVPLTKVALVEALRQFVPLAIINSENKCNRNTYAILYKNNKAVQDKAHKKPSQVGPFRRVEQLIHRINLQHAIACLPVYPQIFQRHIENMDYESINRVEQFQNAIIENHRKTRSLFNMRQQNSKKSDVEIARTISSFKNDANVAYVALKSLTIQDPNAFYMDRVLDEKLGKMVIAKDKIKELFMKYVVEPCQYYVRHLGPDVFIPARYDAVMLDKEDRNELDGDGVDFFLIGYARYRLCQKLIKSKDSLAKGIVSFAEKHTKSK